MEFMKVNPFISQTKKLSSLHELSYLAIRVGIKYMKHQDLNFLENHFVREWGIKMT